MYASLFFTPNYLKRKVLALLWVLLAPTLLRALGTGDDVPGSSAAILSKYLQATQSHDISPRGASMEVDIDATVPNLNQEGKLRALRRISKLGQITYKMLGFQGDNTVKNQVIARYLQAEQQGQGDQSLAITSANYKFKYRGQMTVNDRNVYVFQLSPKTKKVGLFKGEIWLDSASCLPVFEKGRLVKNPSIFFKKVDFERKFRIQDGMVLPENMMSTIDTRLIGKVLLNINYSNFSPSGDTEADDGVAENSSAPPLIAK